MLLHLAACSLWSEPPAPIEAEPQRGRFVTPRIADELELLEAIGYVGEGASKTLQSGVTVNTPEAYPGRNLVTSGHSTEAFLMDMDGTVRHTWSVSFAEASPRRWAVAKNRRVARMAFHWRRARVFENGDLVAMWGGLGLVRLDRDSNVKWTYPRLTHHDLDVTPEGLTYVLTRKNGVVERIHDKRPIAEDHIVVLDPDGAVLKRASVLEALENSPWFGAYEQSSKRVGDIFHTNTVHVLREGDSTHPAFTPGRVLTSLRELDAIGVMDLDENRFVWFHQGDYDAQHDPRITPTGTLVLFDNRGLGQHSRILEFRLTDPPQTVWSLDGTEAFPFYSEVCGAVARLPNGNTLVSETEQGRAFEVTPDKRIVWEFYNPHRGGEDGQMIAKIYEVERLAPNFGEAWLSP